MVLTHEDILKANESLKTVPIKGKDYTPVTEKVRGFRRICPGGTIETDIISLADGVVTMKAVISVDGQVLATGLAQENQNANFINKTSFIENCETSAVGRALAFLGIGSDESIASADEVANAVAQQDYLKSVISEKEQKILVRTIERKGLTVEGCLNGLELGKVTGEIYQDAMKRLSKLKDAENGKDNG